MLLQYNTYSVEQGLLDQIEPLRVEQYLASHGWSKNDGLCNRHRSVYEINSNKSHKRQVKVLYNKSIADYGMVMLITISNIAEHESRTVDDTIRLLIVPSRSDVLKIRAYGGATSGGTISLNGAREMLDGIRRVVLAAAHGVSNPQIYYPRLGDGKADELLKRCQLGQTEIGSFVFTVVCPLDAIPEHNKLFDDEPFARKVTKNLMVTLERVGSCKTEGDCIKLISDEQGRLPVKRDGNDVAIVSKNLCDGIIDIIANSDSNVEIGVDWAAELDSRVGIENSKVVFTQEYIKLLDFLSDGLKPKDTETGSTYLGTVEKCEGIPTGDSIAREGDVVLKIIDDEGEPRNAKVNLPVSEYTQATNAHLKNKKVQIHGILKRAGRTFRITDHDQFAVL